MEYIVGAIVGLVVACIATLVHWFQSAPEGWEDKRGFHYGKKVK